jgi:hypothetical protein
MSNLPYKDQNQKGFLAPLSNDGSGATAAVEYTASSLYMGYWMTKPIPRDPMYRQRAFDAAVLLCEREFKA